METVYSSDFYLGLLCSLLPFVYIQVSGLMSEEKIIPRRCARFLLNIRDICSQCSHVHSEQFDE